MAILADRVRETTSTTGTGTLTLGGAAVGYRSFEASFADGNTTFYVITDGINWEIGLGTYSLGTLSRDSVVKSSNADALVNFGAGSKDVWADVPASEITLSSTTINAGTGLTGGGDLTANRTLSLATLADSGTGSFVKIERDGYGRVSGTTAVTSSDITTALGYVPPTQADVDGTALALAIALG